MIKNEIKLFFSRKNILFFIAAAVSILLIYVFQYEKAYEEYPEEQIKNLESRWGDLEYLETLYSNRVEQLEEYDPEYERLEPIKQTAGILVSLRALCGLQIDCWEDWEKNEDMLRDLQKQEDRKLVDAPDKIEPGEETIFNWDRRDWGQRMLLHEAYEKAGIPEPVHKAVPTGAYVLYHGLEGTGVVFLVLALLMLGWNYDIWSADFDESTSKLLYTLPFSRKRIFSVRCLVHWGLSLLGIVALLGILFLCGSVRFGFGWEDFQVINMQVWKHFSLFSMETAEMGVGDAVVSMGTAVGLRLLLTVLFFTLFFAIIQFVSFAWKSSTSVLVTMMALVTGVVSTMIIPATYEWETYYVELAGQETGLWEKLIPLFYFQNGDILSGAMGIGAPWVLLVEILMSLGIFIGTEIWMKRSEL